jgi:hypothetical protein
MRMTEDQAGVTSETWPAKAIMVGQGHAGLPSASTR